MNKIQLLFHNLFHDRNKVKLAILQRCAQLYKSDEKYLKRLFKYAMGKELNLKNPQTFNEKLQWLKLYNRKPEYTTMVDKYAVKEYVANIIGEEHIIPTLGVWNSVHEIDWDSLPNQFVLKTTHGGGGCDVIICKDKATFDKAVAMEKLNKSLKRDIFWKFREWPYKNVPKRIIAEKFMTNNGKDIEDYKIHSFNGSPLFILVCSNRYGNGAMIDDFYTPEWKLMDLRRPGHPNSTIPTKAPLQLKKMLELSEILSKNIPFLRTDFYVINDRIYFGELTFFPASGMSKFEPEEWDERIGNWLVLENDYCSCYEEKDIK